MECGGKGCNLHLREKAVDEVMFLRLSPTRAGQLNADLSLGRMDGACIQRHNPALVNIAASWYKLPSLLSPGIFNTFKCVCLLVFKTEAISNKKTWQEHTWHTTCFKNCTELF